MKTMNALSHTVASRQPVRRLLAVLMLALTAMAAVAAPAGPQQPFVSDAGDGEAVAIFAGGCFWCMEAAFDPVPGVVSTTSGYTGGHVDDPSYGDVTAETSGHSEAVKIVYKTAETDYDTLLDVFWHNVDPTDDGGQFCDRGDSYRSKIFVVDDAQAKAAEASKTALENDPDAPSPIVTEIVPATTFYAAEDYHQNYYRKNPLRYKFYRASCRRDAILEKRWGDAAGGHAD
ncbi:peptide-methionine (S)-S-oxide reductase MsrA [Salinisphaera sp. T31B1]|uniref:peptide-methionine (S)-S-oxide reductase MsrA n=1 Tax=Salinisphaera sp. T31B1 TaxID=727963 RepID=UPI00333ECF34